MKKLPPFDVSALRLAVSKSELQAEGEIADIELRDEHSNHIAVVSFTSGRRLIVKRARSVELAHRFETSVVASRLLREQTTLIVPEYLEALPAGGLLPALVYWWIPGPTLAEIWPELDDRARQEALFDCGRLFRRIHGFRLRGHGPLLSRLEAPGTLGAYLHEDLAVRLRPAVKDSWEGQVDSVDRLRAAFADHLAERDDPDAVLVHNDVFTENVLCDATSADPRSVGVIDFEDSFAGPREADLAKTEVLHGPLFGRDLGDGWFERVLAGYATEVDERLICLFRVHHLLNMGYHAAVTGVEAHAEDVGSVVRRELDRWRTGHRHESVAR